MTSPLEVWRRNLWSWVVPLAVCVVGLVGLAIYYSAFDGRVAVLEKEYEIRGARLESYRAEAIEIAEFLERVENQKRQVQTLYADHFQTEDQRFTRAITEVKRLARNAGLAPTSFSYPNSEEGPGLIRRSINFGVDGTYRQLRTFINFLELSDQFLTLESITLSGSSEGDKEPTLGIGLRLATFFATSEVEVDERDALDGDGSTEEETENNTENTVENTVDMPHDRGGPPDGESPVGPRADASEVAAQGEEVEE